jgi:hypothetical protein
MSAMIPIDLLQYDKHNFYEPNLIPSDRDDSNFITNERILSDFTWNSFYNDFPTQSQQWQLQHPPLFEPQVLLASNNPPTMSLFEHSHQNAEMSRSAGDCEELQKQRRLLTLKRQLVEQQEQYFKSMAEYAILANPLPGTPQLSKDLVICGTRSNSIELPMGHGSLTTIERKRSASERKKEREYARNLTCFNCKTTKTPLWRRTADKLHNLCNACGLYFKQYSFHRPVAYKERAPRVHKRTIPKEQFNMGQIMGTVVQQRSQSL